MGFSMMYILKPIFFVCKAFVLWGYLVKFNIFLKKYPVKNDSVFKNNIYLRLRRGIKTGGIK